MPSSKQISPENKLNRAVAPLAFIVALLLILVFFYDSGFTSLPPTEKRYVAAKSKIITLKNDDKQNDKREPWEKLANEFHSIYLSDPSWPNRPAALFKEAESLEELAKRSCSKSDAKKAISCYETLALRHATSRLADDALFRAARLRAATLKDDNGALILIKRLKKQYPDGDMIEDAVLLEKAILASVNGRTLPELLKSPSAQFADNIEDQPDAPAKNSKKNFSGDLPLQYKAALSRLNALRKDNLRACWRQPWEQLRDEFLRIRKKSRSALGGNSLFQAAVCQNIIAECSKLRSDFSKAANLYLEVANKYPTGIFADAALFEAAKLQRKNKTQAAIATLNNLVKNYPSSERHEDAKKLLAKWTEEDSPPRAAAAEILPDKIDDSEKPELQVLSWNSPDKNNVEIILEMSGNVNYTTRLAEPEKGIPARLSIDLENASVVSDVRKGVKVQGSLLKEIQVKDLKKGGSTLQFDFRDVKYFDTKVEEEPFRIILSVASVIKKNKNNVKENKDSINSDVLNIQPANSLSDIASQLGLTVQRIFIDAGHGGKDPGTNHNNIFERTISLDVALKLGRYLKNNGLEVVYSRDSDKTLQLSQRTRLANAANADIFVSIHVNANENSAINGFETYFLNLASNRQAASVAMLENAGSDKRLHDMQGVLADVMLNARINESQRLARIIQRFSLRRIKKQAFEIKDNGVKSAPFHVLVGTQMPAVLVELGYCTNKEDAKNLANPRFRNALAEGLAEGILAYRDRLQRNQTAQNTETDK